MKVLPFELFNYMMSHTTEEILGYAGDLSQKQNDIGHALKTIVAMDGVRGECWIDIC